MDTTLNPVFMTAIEMVDDETYLGADGRHLFICQKNRFYSQTCERECTCTYILYMYSDMPKTSGSIRVAIVAAIGTCL